MPYWNFVVLWDPICLFLILERKLLVFHLGTFPLCPCPQRSSPVSFHNSTPSTQESDITLEEVVERFYESKIVNDSRESLISRQRNILKLVIVAITICTIPVQDHARQIPGYREGYSKKSQCEVKNLAISFWSLLGNGNLCF